MSPHDPIDTGDDPDLLAAELALGVLDGAARQEAQARQAIDPAFAAEVAQWEARFAPWLDAIAAEAPPARAWDRISAVLWGESAGRADARTPRPVPLLQRLGFWRGLAAGGFALAMLAWLALFLLPRAPAPVPPAGHPPVVVAPPAAAPIVVSLRHDDGSTAYTATLDTATGELVLVPVQLQGDTATSPELWLIPPGEAPRSLGMVPRDRAIRVALPVQLRAVTPDTLFAISLEPAGSGPHAAPTGPVVAKGSPLQL